MRKYIILFLITLIFPGCLFGQLQNIFQNSKLKNHSQKNIEHNSYESGQLSQIAKDTFSITMRDDNFDESLAAKYRNWFYINIDNVSTYDTTTIFVRGSGWPARFLLPVFSYDGLTWHRFNNNEVIADKSTKVGKRYFFNMKLKKKFDYNRVTVARYYPYTYEKLISFLYKYYSDKFIKESVIGLSPKNNPIKKLTITNPYNMKKKKHIWIHSRTHPSETPTSFMIEGIIDELLKPENRQFLSDIVVHIVPMLNVDGVKANNSRRSPLGYDIERQWIRDTHDSTQLIPNVAKEVQILRQTINDLKETGANLIMALNLHSTNSEQGAHNFIFSNFSPLGENFGDAERIIWLKQAKFVHYINLNYCDSVYAFSNLKIKTNILSKPYPESWWWANFQSKVMALTIESTFNCNSCSQGLATPEDHIYFGRAIARAIIMYARKSDTFLLPTKDEIDSLKGYWKHLHLDDK